MKVAVVHLHVVGLNSDYDPETENVSGTFEFCAERFVSTYRNFPADHPHELIVVCAKGQPPNLRIYENLPCKFLFYDGDGFCSGAHQFASFNTDADFVVYNSARTHFWKRGWLQRLVAARTIFGDGFYGTMASNEGTPHLRTNCYCVNPEFFRQCTHPLIDRPASRCLESGEWSMSRRFHLEGKPSMLVTWDGVFPMESWRLPSNGFRSGNQSDCLVWDRHTEIFSRADDDERMRLEVLSNGQ